MAARKKSDDEHKKSGHGSGALGFEAKLWETADKLRGHMDAAEYMLTSRSCRAASF